MSRIACRICGCTQGKISTFTEQIFETFEDFDYFECSQCKCVQLIDIPADMSIYYPAEYESHKKVRSKKFNLIKKMFYSSLLKHKIKKFSPIGRIFSLFCKTPNYIEWLTIANISPDSKVLDAGCGMGGLLSKLWLAGIKELHGIDPFIDSSFSYTKNLHIFKMNIEECNNKYDLIFCNHALEHIPDPNILVKYRELLNEGGRLIIRIPLAHKYLWRKYGKHWSQIDAPRHIYLHSEDSLALMAKKAGFEIFKTMYDCNPRHIANSIKLAKGISYKDKNKDIFSFKELKHFEDLSKNLNEGADGDQATFFLRAI